MGKIKVLHRAATTGIGGVESYVLNHYQYMDKSQFQFDFITRNLNLAEAQRVKEQKIAVHTFTATEKENRDLLVEQINSILDQGFDALHMNTSVWAGFLIEELAMQRGIPKVIVHAHSTGVDFTQGEKRKHYEEMHEYYKSKFGKKHATHFCACSREAADWMFGSRIPREEIHILKNAIEVEKFSYNEETRNRVRQELGLDECFVIGHIGRFAYQKNHKFLLEVFRELCKYNEKARLLLIGQGELEADIKQQINECALEDKTVLLGWRDDVPQLMQAMDLFVLPSRFEGLPVVLVEAQAAGLRCLTSSFVTKEVGITKNIEFIALDHDKWVNAIKKNMCECLHFSTESEITEAGYNIKFAVKELEKLYEE